MLAAQLESGSARANPISSNEAYEKVRTDGVLSGDGTEPLVVEGVFRLDRATAGLESTGQIKELVFNNVSFAGGIRAERTDIPVSVRFEQCGAAFVKVEDVIWLQPVSFHECKALGRAYFKGGRFKESLNITNSEFAAAYFKRVHFEKPVSLVNSSVEEASFSGSVFSASATFDGTVFEKTAKFFATEFGADVSFVEVSTRGAMLFQRVEFKGEAEFNDCKLARADFGRERTTIFGALANFRDCEFGEAAFNATDFRGRAIFDGAAFRSDVSIENAYFADKTQVSKGLSSKGI